jgi:hypothetical protein
MPKTSQKNIFWLFWTIPSTRMGLLIWLGAHFQAKTLGHTSRLLAGLCVPFLGPSGGAQMPSKDHKNKLFSGCFGPLLLQEWAY